MPRFFFHLHNDVDVEDSEGEILADLPAAVAFATEQARALMAAMVADEGRVALHHRIDIEDEQRVVLASVKFGDAVTIED